jgi:hypothetical protein
MAEFTFYAKGSKKITARHKTTLEITKDDVKTARGDCIVATSSSIGLAELPENVKRELGNDGTKVMLTIEAGGACECIQGSGNSGLTFDNTNEMVVRKSGYVCGRTLMVNADKASVDLKPELIKALKNQGAVIRITISTAQL